TAARGCRAESESVVLGDDGPRAARDGRRQIDRHPPRSRFRRPPRGAQVMAEAAAISGRSAPAPSSAKVLLRAENVVKYFPAGIGSTVHAVDGVSFDIREGETLGLVGESGCGKSTLARLVTQLIPATSGKIFFGDIELTKLRGEKLRQYRRQLQMIFQDPFASLDPRM